MSSGKTDRDLPKSKSKALLTGKISIGSYRCHKDWDKDEFHVHGKVDDKFAMKDILKAEFLLGMFVKMQGIFKNGDIVVFPTDDSPDYDPHDLVYTRAGNEWEARLRKKGTVPGMSIPCDRVLFSLYKIVQGRSGPKLDSLDVAVDAGGIRVSQDKLEFSVSPARRFELAAQRFLDGAFYFEENAVVVFAGDQKDKKKSCNLVLRKSKLGHFGGWEAGLDLAASTKIIGDAVYADNILAGLDEIVQRT